MKKLLCIILATVAIFAFVACNNSTIINEQRDLDNATWNNFQPQTFNFNVPSTDDCYNIYVDATIDTNLFRRQWLPLTFRIDSPSGEHRMFRYDIKAIDEKGYWIGTRQDDGLLKIEARIREYFFFNSTGQTSFQLKQCSDRFDLYGVHSITLRIEKAKLEYPK